MELSDYEVLGLPPNSSFRNVKNAFYDLSRIYHPDSLYLKNNKNIKLSHKECEVAFQRIQTAYNNIKKKLNVLETDLPKTEILYKNDYHIENNIELLNSDSKEFNKKFNKLFEKVSSQENYDNPYSIFYKEPIKENRNLSENKLILHNSSSNKVSNIYEFGINYVDDHSSDMYIDLRKINSDTSNKNIESIKEYVDINLENKLNNLLKERKIEIKITKSESKFIENQEKLKKEIEQSKNRIIKERTKMYLN